MQHDFNDKSFLITGAGRGLGKHLAQYLAGFGATVGVADIDGGNARNAAAEIERAGGRAIAYEADVGARDAYIEVADDFARRAGRIDAIVNNAMMLRHGLPEPLRHADVATDFRQLWLGQHAVLGRPRARSDVRVSHGRRDAAGTEYRALSAAIGYRSVGRDLI